MNSAEYVLAKIGEMKAAGLPLQEVAWRGALLCVGWPYVYGARGEECTPANRRSRYRADHPTIKTKCKNFDGAGTCAGCAWYPDKRRTLFFDCRGFTYWVLRQVYGFSLSGAGATSQWNASGNWTAQGTIDTCPQGVLVCLFVANGQKMEHTGFGYNGQSVECGNGVQYMKKRARKWTHWALPACTASTAPPTPAPAPDRPPTLRRGASGAYVTLAQTKLIQQGYTCGTYGADGKFGSATEKAVRAFQTDNGLAPDGIIGPQTWAALESKPATYTVTIEHVTTAQLEQIRAICPAAQAVSEV